MDTRPYGIALFALGLGSMVACGGGGGGSAPAGPGTSTPVTAAPATATPTATAAPATSTPTAVATASTAPAVTPGPVTASWAGINGYTATSPPNFAPSFASPQPNGFVGEFGPRIIFTAVGQTVHVVVTQANSGGSTPSSLSVGCNNVSGTLVSANAVNGAGSGSFDLTLAKTTGSDPNCSIGINGSTGFNFGNYLGGTEILFVEGP